MFVTTTPWLSNIDIESELFATHGNISSSRCRTLLMLAELDHRRAWRDLSCRSGVHWLCSKLGLGRRAATEQMRVALALDRLPLITKEFLAGRLSYSKVRAITRIAGPDSEAELLRTALECTAGKLERIVRQRRTVDATDDDADRGDEAPPDRGELRWRWDDDGCLRVSLRLPAERGKLLVAELEKLVAGMPNPEQHDAPSTSAEQPEHAPAEPVSDRPSAGTSAEDAVRPGRSLAALRAAALLELVTGHSHNRASRRRANGRRPSGGRSRPVQRGRRPGHRTMRSRAGDPPRCSTPSNWNRATEAADVPAPRPSPRANAEWRTTRGSADRAPRLS